MNENVNNKMNRILERGHKKLFLAIFLGAFFAQAYGQVDTMPKADGLYGYMEVISVDSLNKDALFNNAKTFFVDVFKSAKDVIQYEDKPEGKIIGKGLITVTGNQNKVMGQSWERKIKAYFSIEILCKDNKYKYRIYDITLKSYDQYTSREKAPIVNDQTFETLIEDSNKGTYKKATSEAYPKLLTEFKNIVAQLKLYMVKKSDW